MLKSGNSIRDLLFVDKPTKDRLIITPILDWDTQLNDGSASIDLRLGSTFRIPRRSQLLSIDPINANGYEVDKARYTEEIYVELGESFILHPSQFTLGITLEWIHLPNNLAAFITGRSTWGRDGLIIETAAGVHPGYSGNLTLELTNVGEVPIILYPGLAYVQIFIYDVEQEADVPGDRSAFLGTTSPSSGKVSDNELEKIRKLKKMRANK